MRRRPGVWLSLVLILTIACCPALAETKPELELTIKALGWGKDGNHYPSGRPILIQLAIANHGQVSSEVRLKDHGKDGGQELLWGLFARVTDKAGKLLTRDERDVHGDDWWSSALVSSDSCAGQECEMAGDRVSIPPGQTVLRKVDLDVLIANCPRLLKGLDYVKLPAGSYTVQLSLNGLISGPIQIVVD